MAMAANNWRDRRGVNQRGFSKLIGGFGFLCCLAPAFLIPVTAVVGQDTAVSVQDLGSNQETDKKRQSPAQVAERKGGGNDSTNDTLNIDLAKRREVLEFVNEHQPEIKRLLGLLENNRPGQYSIAFRSLVREVDRLKLIQQRSPARFDLALAIWKNQKSTDMLVAQTAIRGDNQRSRDRLIKLLFDPEKTRTLLFITKRDDFIALCAIARLPHPTPANRTSTTSMSRDID